MSYIREYLDSMVWQNMVNFAIPLPALTSPYLEGRTMILDTLAEISAIVQMDDPRPAVEEMIRRFQADIKGVKLPHVPAEGVEVESAQEMPPHLFVSYMKKEVSNTLIRLLDTADRE